MQKLFLDLNKREKIKYLNDKKIKTQIEGDLFDVEGNISDCEIYENDIDYYIFVTFSKNSVFNEEVIIIYDNRFNPFGKLAYAINEKDALISFDYFFILKELRGQGFGQAILDIFLDKMDEKFDSYKVFTNPYSFDVTFNGIKGYDYGSKNHQYKLEQFYLNNGFLLSEEPRKFVFGGSEYNENEYKLTNKPVDDYYIIHKFGDKKWVK